MVTFEALAFCDLVQCLHKRLGIIPRYCFHRAVIVLKTRRVIAVHHRFPQSLGYRVFSNIKIRDAYLVDGSAGIPEVAVLVAHIELCRLGRGSSRIRGRWRLL